MLSRSLPILLPCLLLVSCAAGEKRPFVTQLAFAGPAAGEPVRLTARGRLPARDRSPRILLGRAGPGGEPIALAGIEDRTAADEKQAHRLAGIVQWTLSRELALDDDLGLTIVLFPGTGDRSCILEAELPLEDGMAFGIPSSQDQISKAHASGFLYGSIYFYVSTFFTDPRLGKIQLAHRDERNAWIIDGASRLAATIAFLHALRDRERAGDLASLSFVPALEAERSRGTSTVALIDRETGEVNSVLAPALRQAAAELILFRWYMAARKNGVERPLAELARWARGHPLGPTYEQLTEWMWRASGVNVASEAKETPLQVLIAYHRSNWLNLGWRQAAESPPAKS